MSVPKIAVCSLFRDCVDDVRRTFIERSKWKYDRNKIVHICMEGDSVDGTWEEFDSIHGFNIIKEKIDSGSPKYGSFAIPERLILLANLWNRALDLAVSEKAHYILMLDSDIITPPNIIQNLMSHGLPVVAPMFYFENSDFFRDTWGYRVNNEQFSNRYPYHPAFKNGKLFEASSVGVPFMKYEVVKNGARCTDQEVVGLCGSITKLGYKIYIDSMTSVYHPRIEGIDIPKCCEKYDKTNNR